VRAADGNLGIALRRHHRGTGEDVKIVDAELKAVHRHEWERAFRLFRLLI
jgi:hypothetical protein